RWHRDVATARRDRPRCRAKRATAAPRATGVRRGWRGGLSRGKLYALVEPVETAPGLVFVRTAVRLGHRMGRRGTGRDREHRFLQEGLGPVDVRGVGGRDAVDAAH